ncbi:hypothetical protein BCD67_11820 [Oscillatoriales cyanobacterium USR001]|nr:hypothetical protein BCD67_11820 [Oscillatoriales cyanobacterium USR001]
MKEQLINALNFFGLAWWVEIVTQAPLCTYYFGPFLTESEAEIEKAGYIEDLENEGAIGIMVTVKRCKPENLTIGEDLGKISDRGIWPVLSGQP